MKIILFIIGGILLLFGVLFLWAAFGPTFNAGWFIVGLIMIGIGVALIWFATRQKASSQANNVTIKVDLPADVNMDKLQCTNCGGTIKPENVTMVAGAPVVNCPYCGTTYQLTEEPKW